MENINYQILRSRRKTIALEIRPDGSVLVRAPVHMSDRAVADFVASKHSWLEKHLSDRRPSPPRLSPQALQELGSRAAAWFPERVRRFAPLVGVSYGRITIRAQHTRWGSCSARGNLNLNCLLMLCPEEVRDYVVVHELCHRKHMDHSNRFWAEVARVMPDYAQHRQYLKDHGAQLLAQLPQ